MGFWPSSVRSFDAAASLMISRSEKWTFSAPVCFLSAQLLTRSEAARTFLGDQRSRDFRARRCRKAYLGRCQNKLKAISGGMQGSSIEEGALTFDRNMKDEFPKAFIAVRWNKGIVSFCGSIKERFYITVLWGFLYGWHFKNAVYCRFDFILFGGKWGSGYVLILPHETNCRKIIQLNWI